MEMMNLLNYNYLDLIETYINNIKLIIMIIIFIYIDLIYRKYNQLFIQNLEIRSEINEIKTNERELKMLECLSNYKSSTKNSSLISLSNMNDLEMRIINTNDKVNNVIEDINDLKIENEKLKKTLFSPEIRIAIHSLNKKCIYDKNKILNDIIFYIKDKEYITEERIYENIENFIKHMEENGCGLNEMSKIKQNNNNIKEYNGFLKRLNITNRGMNVYNSLTEFIKDIYISNYYIIDNELLYIQKIYKIDENIEQLNVIYDIIK